MTSLLSAKKRAEEFAAAVDGDADRSALRPELAELVGVVATLRDEARAGETVAPRPEFTADLRERLMAEAATSLAQDNLLVLPTRRKGSRERRIALAASSLVLVGGTAGMAAAAQNALPGEALYPIKRGLEKAQTGLATSQADKGRDLLAQADSRLVEVQGLFDSSADLSQVSGTIDDFTRQAIEASDVLLDEFESSRDPGIIEELRTFAADNLEELQELAKNAPAEHQDELATAAEALMQIDARAQELCPSCASDLDSLEMPTLFLTANEARDAMEAIGQVQLNNDHPVITDEGRSKPGGGKDKAPSGDGGDEPAPEDETPGTPDDSDLPDIPTGDVDTNAPDGEGKDLGEIIEDGTDGLDQGGLGTGGKSGGKDGTGGTGGKVKDVLPDELDPVVDTILP